MTQPNPLKTKIYDPLPTQPTDNSGVQYVDTIEITRRRLHFSDKVASSTVVALEVRPDVARRTEFVVESSVVGVDNVDKRTVVAAYLQALALARVSQRR